MKKFIILILLVLFPSISFAAGSCTMTSEGIHDLIYIVWDWTSDASGDVSGATCITTPTSGIVLNSITKPSASAAPTDNYDIDVEDATDVVITGTYLDNRDTAEIERLTPLGTDGLKIYLYKDELELIVSAAGNVKQGQFILVLYPLE